MIGTVSLRDIVNRVEIRRRLGFRSCIEGIISDHMLSEITLVTALTPAARGQDAQCPERADW